MGKKRRWYIRGTFVSFHPLICKWVSCVGHLFIVGRWRGDRLMSHSVHGLSLLFQWLCNCSFVEKCSSLKRRRGKCSSQENIKNVECLFFFFSLGSYSVNCCVNAALPVTFFHRQIISSRRMQISYRFFAILSIISENVKISWKKLSTVDSDPKDSSVSLCIQPILVTHPQFFWPFM